jgi:eukaryotic-like serine/threonine-protein kinase
MPEMSSAEEIFFAALERATPAERTAYLDIACAGNPALRARVEHLLAAHPRVGGFPEPAATTDESRQQPPAAKTDFGTPDLLAGTLVVGKYKLLQQIGEGGMGTVWLAEQQAPVRRMVALKLVKAGMDSSKVVARFEAERQALALMDHPNIARIYDAGIAGQRPFFVMELVKGTPITKYCDEHRISPKERLELFVSVCQAIQHAHQ